MLLICYNERVKKSILSILSYWYLSDLICAFVRFNDDIGTNAMSFNWNKNLPCTKQNNYSNYKI